MRQLEKFDESLKRKLSYLRDEAVRVAQKAYCPYSHFHVGAAIQVNTGENSCIRLVGVNVENASYGLTICAERNVIFQAASWGFRKIDMLAVATPDNTEDSPIGWRMPCGACRQVMSEFMDKDSLIFVDGVGVFTVDELLPTPFTLEVN